MKSRFKPSEAGKGDQPRPAQVDNKTLTENWDAINWGGPKPERKEKPNGTNIPTDKA